MDKELKNKYLDMLMDLFSNELAADDFKSVLKNIAKNIDKSIARDADWGDCQGMFTILYETAPECIDNIDPDMLWKFTTANNYLEEFKIPEHITSIKNYAFYDCPNLTVYTKNQYVIDYCKENKIEYKEEI